MFLSSMLPEKKKAQPFKDRGCTLRNSLCPFNGSLTNEILSCHLWMRSTALLFPKQNAIIGILHNT